MTDTQVRNQIRELTENTMGIFDWLKKPKSNIDQLDDLIWLASLFIGPIATLLIVVMPNVSPVP